MTITTHYYLAPAHWACAAVYGDDDGLERADARAARRWLASLPGDVVDVIDENAYYERYEPGDDTGEPPLNWPADAETPGYHAVHDASWVSPYGAECAVYVVHEHARP